ncbi:MAG TPA: phospho-sugar mutase [Thermoguttaceae bacterium]|nr:phospho-sugar mutase [Thermoguttaceae bacterium]
MAASSPNDITNALEQITAAGEQGKLSPGAVENLRRWLVEPRYADYVPEVLRHVAEGRWAELDDVFWTVIPFGTGGRRGRMYPIGSNAINDRTIGESAQGLADYVISQSGGKSLSCAIAYDTRHRSPQFARLCAEVMAAAGFKVWFLEGFRSTPELSFAVRYKKCDCGIIVTASHNPPSDNAVKAYWSTGGQMVPPHDKGVVECVARVADIRRVPFDEALASGQIEFCQDDVDRAFLDAVARQSRPGPRDLKIIYSPLHGVGASAVLPALARAGFKQVSTYGPHSEPDGDFPNVPGHVSNPENPRVFDPIVVEARRDAVDLILATDPDCDRVGCAAPTTIDTTGPWDILTGNQIGAVLADYLLEMGPTVGKYTPEHYLVKTVVTTELIRRIGDAHGVTTIGDLMVGFKWIGDAMDRRDPAKFIMGAEESYGFLIGDHARDKDAAVASMILAELTARAKAEGLSLHQKLDALFVKYGCHGERTVSVTMPGAEGMDRMKALMARLRQSPPPSLAGIAVAQSRDYLNQTVTPLGGHPRPLAGPKGDVVLLDLAEQGNYLAVRPSGTEPKVKFYMFSYDGPGASQNLAAVKETQSWRLLAMETDLKAFAGV